jgi:hypothetical protein
LRLPSIFQKLMLSSIWQKIGVVFHFSKYWGCLLTAKIFRLSSICQNIEVVFYLLKYWGHLPYLTIFKLSSICQNIEIIFHYWACLRFAKILRSSSICQIIEVFFHLSSIKWKYYVKNEVVFHIYRVSLTIRISFTK